MTEAVREGGSRRARRPGAFDLKARQFDLLGLILHSADGAQIEAQWRERAATTLFDHDPVVIDLSQLSRSAPAPAAPSVGQAPLALDAPPEIDLAALVALLRASRLQPVAVAGATPAELAQAQALGLADATAGPAATSEPSATAAASPTREVVREVIREVVKEVVVERPAEPAPTLVIDKPLRSGQQVYAKGGDLVVLRMVNPGAEVIADGHIHVYAPLRGKAIAGARGDTGARIFSLCLEPELISIAGVYRTSDVPLPADVWGKPTQVRLEGGTEGKLLMQPLKA